MSRVMPLTFFLTTEVSAVMPPIPLVLMELVSRVMPAFLFATSRVIPPCLPEAPVEWLNDVAD